MAPLLLGLFGRRGVSSAHQSSSGCLRPLELYVVAGFSISDFAIFSVSGFFKVGDVCLRTGYGLVIFFKVGDGPVVFLEIGRLSFLEIIGGVIITQ